MRKAIAMVLAIVTCLTSIALPASAADKVTAQPTASTVYLNGKAVEFEAYTISGSNYFKLRDLAYALSGTPKQFAVGWDGDANAISLISGDSYEPVGGELAKGNGKAKEASPTSSRVYFDGIELRLTAYNIGGNNFFKLRDLMEAINVYVGYNESTKAITLDTGKGYEKPAGTTPNLDIAAPKTNEILTMAKKYYDTHSTKLQSSLKSEFTGDVGAVNFDGKLNDSKKAEKLCNTAAVIAMFEGDGDYAVGCAAAAVGWASMYARSAGTLAALLETAGFITDGNRLTDAKKLAEYAISLDKNDIDFYITLARVLYRLGDIDGALKAIEAALAIEPGNNAALMFKIEILNKKGGASLSSSAPALGMALRANDGELSKSLTELEQKTAGMTEATDDDSKAEVLSKLEQLYTLEPLTSADMMEEIFPSESTQIRRQVNTVSAGDMAKLTKNFPIFPNGLYRTRRQVDEMRDEIKEYWDWIHYTCADDRSNKYLQAFTEAEAARAQRGKSISLDSPNATTLDYQWGYNRQIFLAAHRSFLCYTRKISDDYVKEWGDISGKQSRKYKEAKEILDRELLEAGHLNVGGHNNCHCSVYYRKFERACNEAAEIHFKEMLPLVSKFYDEIKKVAVRHWEKTLPFARATQYPESDALYLYNDVLETVWWAMDRLSAAGVGNTFYYPELTEADNASIEEAIKALQELKAQQTTVFEDATNGFTISIEFGPFEFKVSNNKVEVEYVNIIAAKVSFDWKKQELELGVGVGFKGKINKAPLFDGDVKYYNNFVIDVRKKEVTDVYISAEAKASFSGFEGGAQMKISVMGNGTSLSTAAKQKLGNYMIEHEAEIIKK